MPLVVRCDFIAFLRGAILDWSFTKNIVRDIRFWLYSILDEL